MRLASITNWAYGITVGLTIMSGTAMLVAATTIEHERQSFERRHNLGAAISGLERDVLRLSDKAREYLNTGQAGYLASYKAEEALLQQDEKQIERLVAAGVRQSEVATLREAIRRAETLHHEQQQAIAAFRQGNETSARQLLFGPEYERELDQIVMKIDLFEDQLEQRLEAEVQSANFLSRLWRTIAEISLGITSLVFLAVLYFVFKRRVVHPVIKLSDVVNRLAKQDYAAELPNIDQIDEIGDMALAIAAFRDNGLERQRLESQREADRQVRDCLSNMTQRLQGCEGLSELQGVLRKFVPEIAPGWAGRLYLLDHERNAVVETCAWLDPRHSVPEFAPNACWGLRRAMPHYSRGGGVDVPCTHLDDTEGAMPGTVCFPLMAQRETVGLLYFESVGAETDGSRSDPYLEILAENIGLALANLRLRERLEDMAMRDPLTRLFNRRKLAEMVPNLAREAARKGQPLSCVMLDVDHFKRFNDQFGHDAGDLVLREVGAALKSATRLNEDAYRYGGEEFLLLLPGTDLETAGRRAEDIRARIAALEIKTADGYLGPVTASFGVSTLSQPERYDDLVPCADAALLHAKDAGRNRVELALPRREDDGTAASAA